MNKKYFFLFFLVFIFWGCKREVIFDENNTINYQLKKCIYEYMIKNVIVNENDYVLSLQKKIKGDTIEFIIYAHNSIESFNRYRVYYPVKYLNTYIFSNYRNISFNDSCGLKKAAKNLNKEEYKYFIKNNKIPEPIYLTSFRRLRLFFLNNKLIKKEYII